MTSEQPKLKLIAPAPVVFGVPFVIGVVLHFLFPSITLGMPTPLALGLGAALLTASVALGSWSIATMFRSGEHPDPRHPTNSLVESGPYGFSRNPIYVAFFLGGLGIGLGINSIFILAASVIGALAVDRLVIAKEEDYLARLFGETFAAYRARVRRWI